ncbi:MAG: ABC transporter ATP-binding protein [Candidatus Cyclobacteriaceae bacterium M2_1C_046]
MEIILENISKRYIHEWIFKHISVKIEAGSKWAIVGPNGSGKSTLLQIISAFRLPSGGKISYISQGNNLDADLVYSKINFVSPYLELIEEFTLKELLDFHFSWRKKIMEYDQITSLFNLEKALHKPIKYFSSGMKQRLKLALAFGTESSVLLLDEPTANLDAAGIEIYQHCINDLLYNRTLVIASNDPDEYKMCKSFIEINKHK